MTTPSKTAAHRWPVLPSKSGAVAQTQDHWITLGLGGLAVISLMLLMVLVLNIQSTEIRINQVQHRQKTLQEKVKAEAQIKGDGLARVSSVDAPKALAQTKALHPGQGRVQLDADPQHTRITLWLPQDPVQRQALLRQILQTPLPQSCDLQVIRSDENLQQLQVTHACLTPQNDLVGLFTPDGPVQP